MLSLRLQPSFRRNLNNHHGTAPTSSSWVVSRPSFPDLTGFDATALFLQSDGEGVLGTYDGLDATGTINLPAPVDKSKPFQCGALLEWNGDSRRIAMRLVSADNDSYLSLSCSVDSGDLRIETGTHTFFQLLTGLTSGDSFWLGVAWDTTGKAIIWATHASARKPLNDPAVFHGPVHYDYVVPIDKNYNGGAGGNGVMLQNVTAVKVITQSITSRCLSLFARQGSYASGPPDRIEPPITVNPVINGDTTPLLRVPTWSPGDPRDLILVFHGANSSELNGSGVGVGADDGVAIGKLLNAGYLIATMRGTDDFSGTTYSGPKASNWGATGPLTSFWLPWIAWIRARYGVRHVYLLGLSMGLENALRVHHLLSGGVRAIAGISGVCNLSYAYASEGNAVGIAAAYAADGVTVDDVTDLAPYDPIQHPSYYDIPITFWHGDADATVSKLHHADAFASAVGGNVSVVSVPGADHLAPACFDGDALIAFFQSTA